MPIKIEYPRFIRYKIPNKELFGRVIYSNIFGPGDVPNPLILLVEFHNGTKMSLVWPHPNAEEATEEEYSLFIVMDK